MRTLTDAHLLFDGRNLAGHPGKGLNFSFQRERLSWNSPCLRALRSLKVRRHRLRASDRRYEIAR